MPVVLSYRNSGAYGCDARDRLTPTPWVYGPFYVESCTNHKRGHLPWPLALRSSLLALGSSAERGELPEESAVSKK
jgi:hypothetical protein